MVAAALKFDRPRCVSASFFADSLGYGDMVKEFSGGVRHRLFALGSYLDWNKNRLEEGHD